MRIKLRKFSNSNYVLIPKAVMELLGINAGDELALNIEGEKIIINKR